MTTYAISTLGVTYSSYTGLVDGDSFDLGGVSSFILDDSTVDINTISFNGLFQTLIARNTSNTTPIIVQVTGSLIGSTGSLVLDGDTINIGTANGTASQTFNVPPDSNGNYPSVIGYCYIDGVLYTEAPSFANMYADFRGRHFTYNPITGVITFGDGTNGDTPTGDVLIENIYIECNGVSVSLTSSGKISGAGHVVIINPNFATDFIINMNTGATWGVINNISSFQPYELVRHKYSKFNYIGTLSSVNTRCELGQDTVGDYITFQTLSNASTEVLGNVNRAFNGTIEAKIVTQRNSTFSRVRLYNNGGYGYLKIYQGTGAVFTPYGGTGGHWDIEWSDGYLRTDTSPYEICFGRYDGDFSLFYTFVGTLNWTGERKYLFRCQLGKWKFGDSTRQMVFPAGMQLDEMFNLSGTSQGTIDNLRYEGTASSGSRDINNFAPNGWRLSNIEVPNDPDHGMQPEENAEYHFVSCIGQTPQFSKNMSHSTIVTNTARDLGRLAFLPHNVAPNGSMINGADSELIYTGNRVYPENIGTKSRTRSGVISGCGVPTALSIVGFLTNNLTIEYKIWEIDGTEPSTYQPLTLTNVQADTASYTTATRWYFEYTVEKIAGNSEQGYLTGIFLDVPLDPNYLWVEPAPLLPITASNLIDGTRVVVINYTRSTIFEDIIINPVVIDNSVVSGGSGYSIDVRVGGGETTQLGDVILIKANWQSGTQAKLPLRIFAVMTESGITLIDSQEDDEIHNNLIFDGVVGLDGSLVDSSNGGELTANLTDVEININDSNDVFDCRRGIAWWRWVNTTATGALIYDALGLVYNPDEYNIELRGRLKIKNSKVGSELTIINGIWSHFQGDSIIAEDSATIVWVPNDRLYNANNSQITQIKALIDQYLDASISSRATQDSVDNINITIQDSDIHGALDSYISKDDWKADVSGLSTFNPSSDVVANVALVDTVTTNTDMRGTDEALLATSYVAPDNASVSLILEDTNELQGNQGDWLTADVTGLVNIQSDIDEILANHNNPTYYFGSDGTTRVEQPEAYYISLRSVDGLTEIRRITAVDSSNNPTNLLQATGYI